MERDSKLQSFIDAASTAFKHAAPSPFESEIVSKIFGRLGAGAEMSASNERAKAGQQPVCALLPELYASVGTGHQLSTLVRSFADLEHQLSWGTVIDTTGTASANFKGGHSDVMIVGPGGLEDRSDVWLGASLLAPTVRYPDHRHLPEEVYLVVTPGEFRHGESDWFAPGPGGSFYNAPNVRHAMRASSGPLFAFWALCPANRDSAEEISQPSSDALPVNLGRKLHADATS